MSDESETARIGPVEVSVFGFSALPVGPLEGVSTSSEDLQIDPSQFGTTYRGVARGADVQDAQVVA